MCGVGVRFLDFGSKKNYDDVQIDVVVRGFRSHADLEDSTGHVWTELGGRSRKPSVCSWVRFLSKAVLQGLVVVLLQWFDFQVGHDRAELFVVKPYAALVFGFLPVR